MNKYKKIAIIVVRGFAISFLVSTMIEVGIIASDTLFVRTGIYDRSEIAFKPRLILLVFYFLGSLFLFTQSKPIANVLIQGLVDESENEEKSNDKSSTQDKETTNNLN